MSFFQAPQEGIVLLDRTSVPTIVRTDGERREWSGAVARNAAISYVFAFDVMTAVQYIIDQNIAPVLSLSYGSCEVESPNSDLRTFQAWARQANAQGITWFSASGDNGGADCGERSDRRC